MSADRIGMQGRILPALLDRLTDDHPDNRTASEVAWAFSLAQLREAILRDLSWLLNTSAIGATVDLTPYPEVAMSTLNYGVRSRTGQEVDGLNPSALRQEILLSLRRFEPRLLPDSLIVTMIEDGRNGLFQFRIEADLWAQPRPVRMLMRTEPSGTGAVRVVEIYGEDA